LALLGAIWLSLGAERALAWGDRTHPAIVRLAIETLPADVKARFRGQSYQLERFSNEPDTVLRRRLGREEAMRHFIDLDGYMAAPFARFPRYYADAVKLIGRRRVEQYGLLPWVILRKQKELSREFRRKSGGDWVRLAGHLAHYVGDAYQPLHLTVDYDGRMSGASGVHKRFENEVVDARIDVYERAVRRGLAPARELRDARARLFEALFRSYVAKDEIFVADHAARTEPGQGWAGYSRIMDHHLAGMVQRQLGDAATMLGSIWLTAWREAPQ